MEIAVGIFIFIGILCLAYTSVQLGEIDIFQTDYYPVKAIFTSVEGLKKDTNVELSGVGIGKVTEISLDGYDVVVSMLIRDGIKLQDDAIASIRTKGLLGEKYIAIIPGGSSQLLGPGGVIMDTEPPLDIEHLIKDFVFEKVDK